jgi:hypothetical protein
MRLNIVGESRYKFLVSKKPKPEKKPSEAHPWRICPAGRHWVRDYERTVFPSEKNPDGMTSVRGYCRDNRSHKDQFYPDEMTEIASVHFSTLKGGPTAFPSKSGSENAFDTYIRGWTKYWNDIFEPKPKLDPDLVKALIASESTFDPDADGQSKKNRARGLMQLTDGTRTILDDEKGELRDHLINISDTDPYDPNLNIGAGVRWLFHKRELASKKLGRKVTWEEAVQAYKDILGKKDKRSKELFSRFDKVYRKLKRIRGKSKATKKAS